jgi:hypothetical protein
MKWFVLVCLSVVLVGLFSSLGYPAISIKTNKDTYLCYKGACEPVNITIINTKLEKFTILIKADFSDGVILSYKLPYLAVGDTQNILVSNLNIPAGVFTFSFNPSIMGNVKFNISIINSSGAVVAHLDPWLVNYNNRVQINISTATYNYNGVAVPVILNASVLGASACQEGVYCNDSVVTLLDNTRVYYYNDEYNATSNWRLFINASYLNTTHPYSVYFYYNSTNKTRSPYFDGTKVFNFFYDFENYSNNDQPSGHFGGINSPTTINITDSGCFDGKCLINYGSGIDNGDIVIGYSTLVNKIIEFRGNYSVSQFGTYWGTGACTGGYPCGWAGSQGNFFPVAPPINVWHKIVFTSNDTHGNLTINGTTIGNSDLASHTQIVYAYIAETMRMDNVILRDLIEYPVVLAFSGVEAAPPAEYLQVNPVLVDTPITSNCTNVNFSMPPVSSLVLDNCSLWVNGAINYTSYSPVNNTYISVMLSLSNGTFNYSWDCWAGGLYNLSNESGTGLYNASATYEIELACPYPLSSETSCPACLDCVPSAQYCLDNNTLYQEVYRKVYVNGVLTICNETRNIYCKNGCDVDGARCNLGVLDTYSNLGYIFLGVLVALALILYINSKSRIWR